MKGSSPAGKTTQSQINPTQQMQAPFLQGGWNSALDLYNNSPLSYYPNQTLADWRAPDPLMTSGYQNIYNTGQSIDVNARPEYNANYNALGQYAPQIAGYAGQAAANDNPALNSLMTVAQGGGAGMEQLAKTAGGYYLNSNPYLDAAIKAAQDPTQRAYQTSIAPTMDAALASSGRYGSGAQAGLYDTSQQNLGRALGDISTNMSAANYARERQAQDEAARGYVSGQTTAGAAGGDLYNRGLSTGISGLNTASDIQRKMVEMYPQWAAAQFIGPQAELQAGQGLTGIGQQYQQREQAQIEDEKARFYGNQQAPYDTLSRYLENIGAKNPVTGTSSTSTPYFQNPLSSMLGAGFGLTGIGRNLGFGGGGGTAAGAGEGWLSGLTGTGGELTAADFSAGLGESLAPAAVLGLPFGTVICTELVRQGRMPNRWRLAGIRAFARYPTVARHGYHVWAIPSVRHLRRRPYSLYSRFLATTFNWRAEDLAARAGVKGARKLWRGRAVTAAMVLPCLVLGVLAGPQDWQSVYRTGNG